MKCLSFVVVFVALFLAECKPGKRSETANVEGDSTAIRKAYATSPVLTPEESISKMNLTEGFTIKLVAAEPMIAAPVALNFDEHGRIWVLEMQGYMPDTVGTGENEPAGRIVILEDQNKDGVADTSKVFLDSLVMPRALCLIENGILVAEPPFLWYFTIRNDSPVGKTLVDSLYTEGGNVEHWPNGLYRAMDNWIYSANSGKRYRKKGDQWLTERTISRGQWGISQDDNGRLFYNNNSENLLGDYFTPGFAAANSNQRRAAGYMEKIIGNNQVHPARPTPGVNRGYQQGVLDDSLRLVNFTAASGPVIYRGGLFDASFNGNAFVGEPSANLIKRNILQDSSFKVLGKQAYQHTEFLTSSDERFRPVTLYDGPDGALYVVDMYRGIIQHKTYLTPYLKNEIKERNLTNPLNCGRIYKIEPKGKTNPQQEIKVEAGELVKLLGNSNGWTRDKAQQLLIDGKSKEIVPALRENLQKEIDPLLTIHSLWTMEGLGALQIADVLPLMKHTSWPVRMQALSVLPNVISGSSYRQTVALLEQMLYDRDTLAAPYIAFLAKSIEPYNRPVAQQLLLKAINQFPNSLIVADAVISNLKGREESFLTGLASIRADTNMAVFTRLKGVMRDMRNAKNGRNAKILEKELPKGVALFKGTCQTCHGQDGNGIKSLAPPLNNSDWVKGDKNKLIPIVLYGLTGPIMVSGTLYTAPEINGDMPGIGNDAAISDEEIAQVVSYIRKSWNNNSEKVSALEVSNTRKKFNGRQRAFTMEELRKMK